MPASHKRRTARTRARRHQNGEPGSGERRARCPAEFLDGAGALAAWLLPRMQSADLVAIRTGWLSAAGIDAIFPALVRALENGGSAMIVANAPDDMTDAAAYLRLSHLVARFPGQIAVVLAIDVFQHGKVYYIRSRGGREAAYIGSANLTGSGLERNHETGVAFSNGEPIIAQVLESVTSWWQHPAARWLDASYLPGGTLRRAEIPDWPPVLTRFQPGDLVTVGGQPGVVIDSDHIGPADTLTVALDGDDGMPLQISRILPPPEVACPSCQRRRAMPRRRGPHPAPPAPAPRDPGGRAILARTPGRLDSARRHGPAAPGRVGSRGPL